MEYNYPNLEQPPTNTHENYFRVNCSLLKMCTLKKKKKKLFMFLKAA